MSDLALILKIYQKHETFMRVDMCSCSHTPCETAVLLEEIKRLNALANGLLAALGQGEAGYVDVEIQSS